MTDQPRGRGRARGRVHTGEAGGLPPRGIPPAGPVRNVPPVQQSLGPSAPQPRLMAGRGRVTTCVAQTLPGSNSDNEHENEIRRGTVRGRHQPHEGVTLPTKIDFQYVVERKKPDPICFGSKIIRDTNPIGKGLSAFQRRYAYEIFTKITPQTYNVQNITSGIARLQNKVRSNKGVGGLAEGAPRFPHRVRTQIPSPTRYDPEPLRRVTKQSKAPFGRSTLRKFVVSSNTPGAGTYDVIFKRCSRTKTAYNFGQPKMVPAVEEICIPGPTDKCNRCNAICDNDYWHKNYTTFLCHICMEEEKVFHEDYTPEQLKEFQKIRTCSYKHSHEGTTANVFLLSKPKMNKIERLENYLNLYISSV